MKAFFALVVLTLCLAMIDDTDASCRIWRICKESSPPSDDNTADRQTHFNQAVAKAVATKDNEILELQRRCDTLQANLMELQQQASSSTSTTPTAVPTTSTSELSASVAVISDPQPETPALLIKDLKKKTDDVERIKQKLMELSLSGGDDGGNSTFRHENLSISSCAIGDLVLFLWEPQRQHYVMFTSDSTLYFLHADCLEALSLKTGGIRKDYVIAEVTDKEYCQAKKSPNRFKVSIGTKFYRVRAKPSSATGSSTPASPIAASPLSASQ